MLLVAIGCGRIPQILDITKEHSFVVFGTMDGTPLTGFTESEMKKGENLPVYFYETG